MVRNKRYKFIWISFYTIIAWLISSVISLADSISVSVGNIQTWTKSGMVTNTSDGVIFGWQGGSVSNTLSSLGLTTTELQKGFSSTFATDISFWCNNNIGGWCENISGYAKDTVILTQTYTNNLGISVSQNRNITEGYNRNFVNYQDTIIVNANPNITSYSVNLNIYGIDNGYWAGYWGAIVKNPSLSISYTADPQLSSTIVEQLNTLSVNTVTIESEKINTVISEPVKVIETIELTQPVQEQPKQSTEQLKEVNQEQTITKEETPKEQKSSKDELPTGKDNTNVSGSENKTSLGNTQADTKLKQQLDKVEKELKVSDTKIKSVQEIKIDALKSNQPSLSVYENKPFYISKQMVGVPNDAFYNQANLYQPSIYTNITLSSYVNKDPLATRHNMLKEIKEEENDIIIELERLRKTKG